MTLTDVFNEQIARYAAAAFDESQHPRDDVGKFTFGKRLTADEAEAHIARNRAGDARSKHGGKDQQWPAHKGPMVMSRVPIAIFDRLADADHPEDGTYLDWIKSTTDPKRVTDYVKHKIDTPITVNMRTHGRGAWEPFLSDGGHRLAAANQRGDTHINALVPEALHDKLHGQADSQARYAAVDAPLRRSIASAAAETDTEPTFAQKDAGNYRKGRFAWKGMQIVIENPAGTYRKGCSSAGRCWKQLMPHAYGYLSAWERHGVQMSEADGDHIDVFLGPDPESELVFVIDQHHPGRNPGDLSRFDEHKCMLGFHNQAEAREGYLSSYPAGWQGLHAMTALTLPEFRTWLADGDTRRPVARYALTELFDDLLAQYSADAGDAGEKWITINGTHVKIDKDRTIIAGPKNLIGRKPEDLAKPDAIGHDAAHEPESGGLAEDGGTGGPDPRLSGEPGGAPRSQSGDGDDAEWHPRSAATWPSAARASLHAVIADLTPAARRWLRDHEPDFLWISRARLDEQSQRQRDALKSAADIYVEGQRLHFLEGKPAVTKPALQREVVRLAWPAVPDPTRSQVTARAIADGRQIIAEIRRQQNHLPQQSSGVTEAEYASLRNSLDHFEQAPKKQFVLQLDLTRGREEYAKLGRALGIAKAERHYAILAVHLALAHEAEALDQIDELYRDREPAAYRAAVDDAFAETIFESADDDADAETEKYSLTVKFDELFACYAARLATPSQDVDPDVAQYARRLKPAGNQRAMSWAEWKESDHPRGQPENAGEFVEKEQQTAEPTAPAPHAATPTTGDAVSDLPKHIQEFRQELLSQPGSERTEHSILTDAHGTVVGRASGEENGEAVDHFETPRVHDKNENLVFHHNHPWDTSFSHGDLISLTNTEGIKQIWAHSPQASYRLTKKDGVSDRELHRAVMDAYGNGYTAAVDQRLEDTDGPSEERRRRFYKEIADAALKELSEKGLVQYEKFVVDKGAPADTEKAALAETSDDVAQYARLKPAASQKAMSWDEWKEADHPRDDNNQKFVDKDQAGDQTEKPERHDSQGLGDAEKEAIESWSNITYQEAPSAATTTEKQKESFRDLDRAMTKLPEFKGTIYRAMSIWPDQKILNFPEGFKKGGAFVADWPTSASKNEESTYGFGFGVAGPTETVVRMKIQAKTACDISQHVLEEYRDQEEVLLRPGTHYVIESVKHGRGEHGGKTVDMTLRETSTDRKTSGYLKAIGAEGHAAPAAKTKPASTADKYYHGTNMPSLAQSEAGTWFSSSPDFAKAFAGDRTRDRKTGTATVHQGKLDLSGHKLADLTSIGMDKHATPNQVAQAIGIPEADLAKAMQSDVVLREINPATPMAMRYLIARPAFTKLLEAHGFTGIKAKEGLKSPEDYVPTFKIFKPVDLHSPEPATPPRKGK